MIKNQLRAVTVPEWGNLAEEAVKWLPRFSSAVLSGAVFFLAPHQRRVRLKLTHWDKRHVEGIMPARRRSISMKKSTGTADYGAAGELAASLVLVRNVSLFKYSLQLKELNVVSDCEAQDHIKVSCDLDPQSFSKLKMTLTEKGEATVHLLAKLSNLNESNVAQVRSVWRIKERK